jgi:hypothetical protein
MAHGTIVRMQKLPNAASMKVTPVQIHTITVYLIRWRLFRQCVECPTATIAESDPAETAVGCTHAARQLRNAWVVHTPVAKERQMRSLLVGVRLRVVNPANARHSQQQRALERSAW